MPLSVHVSANQMKRSDRILAAAFRELEHWRNAPQLSVAEYNLRHVNDRAFRKSEADRNIVGCNPGQWLNEASTAGIRAANSRAYKELYAQGYAERVVSYLGFGNRRTVALYLTEAGKARAAELLSQITDSATSADSTPAAATSGNPVGVC